jgi:hypothetical protein
MRLDLRVDYSRTWPYGDANRYTREWFGVAATIGFAR